MKTETRYTPGPWRYIREAISGMQDGYNIMGNRSIPLIATAAIKPDGDELNGHEPAYKESEARANARLISAAPDLLAALKEAEKHLSNICPNRYNGGEALSTLSQARAAIAKATGE